MQKSTKDKSRDKSRDKNKDRDKNKSRDKGKGSKDNVTTTRNQLDPESHLVV